MLTTGTWLECILAIGLFAVNNANRQTSKQTKPLIIDPVDVFLDETEYYTVSPELKPRLGSVRS